MAAAAWVRSLSFTSLWSWVGPMELAGSSRNPDHLTVQEGPLSHGLGTAMDQAIHSCQAGLDWGWAGLGWALPPEFSLLLSKSYPVGFTGMALGFPCGTLVAGEREYSICSQGRPKSIVSWRWLTRDAIHFPVPEAWSPHFHPSGSSLVPLSDGPSSGPLSAQQVDQM